MPGVSEFDKNTMNCTTCFATSPRQNARSLPLWNPRARFQLLVCSLLVAGRGDSGDIRVRSQHDSLLPRWVNMPASRPSGMISICKLSTRELRRSSHNGPARCPAARSPQDLVPARVRLTNFGTALTPHRYLANHHRDTPKHHLCH